MCSSDLIFNGFGNFFRFAAVDCVTYEYRTKAIAYVLAGGIVAGFVGPNLVSLTKNVISSAPFAGSYGVLIILYLLSTLASSFLSLPKNVSSKIQTDSKRPLKLIAAQPAFKVAVLCGMLGYGVMSFVMTATPLSMKQHAYLLPDTIFVIQWHVLGMFAPSFFTGNLIKRFGVLQIMFVGGVIGIISILINLLGATVWNFWAALFLLGISWNFLFIGATTLLTDTYQPAEQAIAEGTNDFFVYSTVALSALTAGIVQFYFGWRVINLIALPLLSTILISIIWLYKKH